jgi:hypothetical protein
MAGEAGAPPEPEGGKELLEDRSLVAVGGPHGAGDEHIAIGQP